VVLITTAAILSGALLSMYGSVNDRMRAVNRERLGILTGAGGTLSAAEVPASGRERLTQIALGAQVTGVCSTRNTGLVVLIAADTVIDYTREDFTRGPGWFVDNVANQRLPQCLRVLTRSGTWYRTRTPPAAGSRARAESSRRS
jgi:hypothetical protein